MKSDVWINAKMKVRQDFIKRFVKVEQAEILELGAFASPTFLKSEHNIFYADRLSTEELRMSVSDTAKRAAIVDVDFVVSDGICETALGRKFDLVIANHVIEHTPDLIGWMMRIASVLRPGGALYMAIPDRDYTFDKLRDLTSLRELMLLHEIAAERPPLAHVVDHRWGFRPIFNGAEVWNGTFETKLENSKYSTFGDAYRKVTAVYERENYTDCHCNVFTAGKFRSIMMDLATLDWFPFTLGIVEEAKRPYNEFMAVFNLKARSDAIRHPQDAVPA